MGHLANTLGIPPSGGCNVVRAVLYWYAASMSITAVNKSVFDSLGFTYPLLVTFLHFCFVSIILRVGFAAVKTFPELPSISRQHYAKFIVPIAFFGAAEIALSNLSYSLVSISVMTVIKSSLVVVTYIMAILFGVEKFNAKLLCVVVFIMASISLTVPGMEIKSGWGVIALGGAVVFAAIRWVIVHHQLQEQKFLPLQLMILTQPLSAIFLAPFAFLIDFRNLMEENQLGVDTSRVFYAVILVTVAVFLAFFLIFSEYHLVHVTSSVSLTVAGVGKEVATIVMSIIGFKEDIDVRTCIGIGASIVGIMFYSRQRYQMAKAQTEVGSAQELRMFTTKGDVAAKV